MKEKREIAMNHAGPAERLFEAGRAVQGVYLFLMRNLAEATSESPKVPQPVALLLWDNPRARTVPASG
jgi:hypothetical protein